VPFHERWGVILNEQGRVVDGETNEPVTGLYTAGWIKRGPSGVVGTNKPDAIETVEHMLADLAAGKILAPATANGEATAAFVAAQQPQFFSYADWQKLDELEVEKGEALGTAASQIHHGRRDARRGWQVATRF
jgi:ferredoxin--NADP+ reductase